MRFTSSSRLSRPKRAARILFKDHFRLGGASIECNPNIEDLQLPVDTFREVANRLAQSNELLPESARILQGWRVGFLGRFSEITRSEGRPDALVAI